MPIDFERALGETEDFLRRQLGSRAAREAHKRKVQRGIGEVLRRIRRATLVFVGLLTAVVAYSIFVDPVGLLTWFFALPTIMLIATLALFWPSRRRERGVHETVTSANLQAAASETEGWLLDRCSELPRAALPAVDRILASLSELQPHLAALPPDTPLEGEARRLICKHLPQLVDSYLALSPGARAPHSENTARLAESLEIVSDELSRLSGEIGTDRRLGFETQRRFIESRYRDHG